MKQGYSINTDKIIIEELEKELNITKRYIEEHERSDNQWNDIVNSIKNEAELKLRETQEYYEYIISNLYNDKVDLEKKLQKIEGSRSYKIIKKIRGMLGGKYE